MNTNTTSWATGKAAEQKFAKFIPNPVFATDEQDINEHWDVATPSGIKYDVKSMKRYRRSDPSPTDRLHYVELRNVHGKAGWLYGKADYIVFETRSWWILVNRAKLVEFIEGVIWEGEELTEKPEPYKLYRREGRQDLMTVIPTVDLLSLADDVKKRNE